jgi:hypothetical protein
MKKGDARSCNLLDVTPKRNLQWEIDENGQAVLLVPRFTNRLAVKWLMPRISKPNFHVKLDQYGSFIWNQCDGKTTVAEIAKSMAERFEQPVDSLYGRIGLFLQKLVRDKFLVFDVDRSAA